MVPVFTSPLLATVKVMVFDLPVVAAVDPAVGVITSLAGSATIAVIVVNLVTPPALQMTSSPVLAPAVAELKVKPKEQVAPLASAPGVAVGQVVVVGSALILPADSTEQSRSVSGLVAVMVALPETEAPTRTVPKSIVGHA